MRYRARKIEPHRAAIGLFVVALYPKVISLRVPTCDSAHSWRLHSVAPPGQTVSSMTRYPTQSHYPDTEPTSLYPILMMPIPG